LPLSIKIPPVVDSFIFDWEGVANMARGDHWSRANVLEVIVST